jgi:predicted nucleic acid-binding protein
MILADTSIWVEHLRVPSLALAAWLEQGVILMHPFIMGELMLSGVYRRPDVMEELRTLPSAPNVRAEEAAALIAAAALDGCGIGFVDVVLLASVRLHGDARLWTLDRKLHNVAAGLSIAFEP